MNILTVGNAMLPLADQKKGDMANRKECSKELIVNNVKTGVKVGTVYGGTALAMRVAAGKNDIVSQFLRKGASKVGDLTLPLARKIVKHLPEKACNMLADGVNVLKKNKTLAILGTGLMAAVGIGLNSLIKSAAIHQKYEDKANM